MASSNTNMIMAKVKSFKIFSALCVAALAVAMPACGGADSFKVQGQVEGSPSMNMYVRYYGNDKVMSGVTLVQNGAFSFEGYSKNPTIVEIVDNEGKVMGRFVAENGDELTLNLNRNNPYLIEATGTQANEEWSEFKRANADTLLRGTNASVNALVEKYIASNPDNVVSALIFATHYDASIDPLRADSVSLTIGEEVRGRFLDNFVTVSSRLINADSYAKVDTLRYRPFERDTVNYFLPGKHKASLLVFSAERKQREDSLVPHLKKIVKDKKVYVLDIMLSPDTGTWKRTVALDSIGCDRGWAPGGIFARGVDKLALPQLPYFIVVDSAGVQRYRGGSVLDAQKAASTLFQ